MLQRIPSPVVSLESLLNYFLSAGFREVAPMDRGRHRSYGGGCAQGVGRVANTGFGAGKPGFPYSIRLDCKLPEIQEHAKQANGLTRSSRG